MRQKIIYILIAVLLLKLILSVYGLTWGAPDRWNQDERINAALKIITEKTFYYSNVEKSHPIVYYYFLFLWIAPYLLFLKLTGFDFETVRSAASISWLAMTKASPDFASGLLIVGRSSSVVLGLLTVFIVYLIAKKIFDEKTGIFSALVLTLNLGFLGTNHFARSENLSLFLIVSVLYIWVVLIKDGWHYPKFYLSCFLSGLAIGTKLDSAILLAGIAFILFDMSARPGSLFKKMRILFFTALLIFSGALLGYPRLVIPAKEVVGVKEGIVNAFSGLFTATSSIGVTGHIKFVFLKIIASYNCVVAVFVFAGLALCIIKLKNMNKFVWLLLAILAPYYLIILFLYRFVSTNLFIISFPILSIFGGYGFKMLWDSMARHRMVRMILLSSILTYSIVYAVRADMVFAKNDTRYLCTRWIEEKIPSGATIGIMQEPEVLFSSHLIEKYAIYYNGVRMDYENNSYFKQREALPPDEETFIKKLYGFDYAVVSTWNYMAFETRPNDTLKEKFRDAKRWELIMTFRYDENILFNPRPTYTCPTIFIFRENNGPAGTVSGGEGAR